MLIGWRRCCLRPKDTPVTCRCRQAPACRFYVSPREYLSPSLTHLARVHSLLLPRDLQLPSAPSRCFHRPGQGEIYPFDSFYPRPTISIAHHTFRPFFNKRNPSIASKATNLDVFGFDITRSVTHPREEPVICQSRPLASTAHDPAGMCIPIQPKFSSHPAKAMANIVVTLQCCGPDLMARPWKFSPSRHIIPRHVMKCRRGVSPSSMLPSTPAIVGLTTKRPLSPVAQFMAAQFFFCCQPFDASQGVLRCANHDWK